MPKQNISPVEHPQAVLQEIEWLAQHIVVARKRRGETQAQWARKLGVSQPDHAIHHTGQLHPPRRLVPVGTGDVRFL